MYMYSMERERWTEDVQQSGAKEFKRVQSSRGDGEKRTGLRFDNLDEEEAQDIIIK